jgi:hypothetical protein
MKPIINTLLLLFLFSKLNAQTKPADGIYLVEKLYTSVEKNCSAKEQAVIGYHSRFVAENPEEYFPVTISLTAFVPLELNQAPLLRTNRKTGKALFLQLNDAARQKLEAFTGNHLHREAAIVINGMVTRVVKINERVNSGVIQIAQCDETALAEIIPQLTKHIAN